jgi:hypothetical protein
VKELLGHSEIQTTMRYSHPTPLSKTLAVDTLTDGLSSKHGHYMDTWEAKGGKAKEGHSGVSADYVNACFNRGDRIRTSDLGVPKAKRDILYLFTPIYN